MIMSPHTVIVKMITNWDEAPHLVEVSPAGVAYNPRDARVKGVIREKRTIPSPTDDQPPPRQEGETGGRPRFGQVRDEAGV